MRFIRHASVARYDNTELLRLGAVTAITEGEMVRAVDFQKVGEPSARRPRSHV